MAELDIDTALDWRGRTVVDRQGEKIGTLKEIYLDEDERPHWGAVHTALFGLRQTLVPLDQAALEGDSLRLPFEADHVKDAPSVEPDLQLTAEEEERLHRHYGLTATGGDDAMTRSEEEVRVSTRRRPRERVRLKRYVVTDYVEKKVPVKREKVALERDPARPDGDG
jgi:hypothetical protein